MRAIIAIPTYWTWPRGTPPRPSDAIFDHPTPVDGVSTLPRLLDSLHIVHKPPHEYDTHPYAKLAEDVRRFLYEREKVRMARAQGRATRAEVERLVRSPYPGRFLAEDVEEHALAALRALADEEATRLWGTPETIVEEARERARTLAPHYTAFAGAWPTLISNLQYPISDT